MFTYGLRVFLVSVLSLILSSSVSSGESQVDRGRYLVRTSMACIDCHGMDLSGGISIKEAGFTANVPNITQDPDNGIGAWSDAEIIKAIREGVRPDGVIVGPPMPVPAYRNVSDTDAAAIVAYLRTVAPVAKKVAPSDYPMGRPPTYGPPVGAVPDVDRSDTLAYGAYVAELAHCFECHTPVDENFQHQRHKMGAGGFEFHMPDGTVAVSANLTPAGNLPTYSDEEVKTIIRTGVRPDGSKLIPMMAFYAYKDIRDEDLDALVAFLRTLKPAE